MPLAQVPEAEIYKHMSSTDRKHKHGQPDEIIFTQVASSEKELAFYMCNRLPFTFNDHFSQGYSRSDSLLGAFALLLYSCAKLTSLCLSPKSGSKKPYHINLQTGTFFYWQIYMITLIWFEWGIVPFSGYSEIHKILTCHHLTEKWPVLSESSHALCAVVLKASWKAGYCNQGSQELIQGKNFLQT